ncbi:MAG: glycosyltransferase [Pyrinomonadaceae bacterium]|nr:glycosyltransferase [Pyrinomonadaceae bacterium]MCX7640717.1 glycosyltransferase [Pyrinomonadaceae bacterium]MDW8305315.1 glycosyltransferase [Acidobacteriota bacterium]
MKKQVFYESSGKRKKLIRFTFGIFAFVFTAVSGIFLYSLFSFPSVGASKLNDKPIHATSTENTKTHQKSSDTIFAAFYVNYDDSSYASLSRNLDEITWIIPQWISLQKERVVFDPDQRVFELLSEKKSDIAVLPMVQNYTDQKWNIQVLESWIKNKDSRDELVSTLLGIVKGNKFAGVVIDFEEVPSSLQPHLKDFMSVLTKRFHEEGLLVAQAVPLDNPDWDYKFYAENSDYLMLMAYDEHWSVSKPGAIASQKWYESNIKKRLSELDTRKTIVCIGNYGYDWSDKETEAKELSFQETVLSARDSDAALEFDSETRNPHFEFEEEDGSYHRVWFLDAVTAFNQMKLASRFKPAGFAIWRLGSEDPSLWKIIDSDISELNPENLRYIRYGYDIDFEGTGEILKVVAQPEEGERSFELDQEGFIKNEIYVKIPSSYVIQRTGDHPGWVALTFDDGPDPIWTPKILDILKQENVKASFFIVGANGEQNPGLVRRIVEEGHDIGNHSFTHPNMGKVPLKITDLELNATQRLIQSLTGRGTILFRPPYFGDAEPQTPDEVEPIVEASRLGYIAVGLHIDPEDWKTPGAETITERVIDAILNPSEDENKRGQIVLLHDSGGDRSQTVEALPKIIETLKSKGYKFVTVSELAGISQQQSMPEVPPHETVITKADELAFSSIWIFGKALNAVFVLGILLGIARLGLMLILLLKKKYKGGETSGYLPLVSIVIPAFNEEKVIVKTLRSIFRQDYPNFEIIVVDDGSTDRTSEVIRESFSDERLFVFRIENSGKAEALNYGIRRAKGEIVITLDADTVFATETVKNLVSHFRDKKVGAVAGNAKVGNRINLMTKWQAVEYITVQNMEKRAMSAVNAITVVPGAVGAWRREAIEEAGLFQADTLAEDQDLTIRVRKLGYRIVYAEDAIAFTEAPDSFRGFIRQRFRWCFGTLQCMWKHREILFNKTYGTYGLLAMPNVLIFHIIFPLIAPLMDFVFFVSLAFWGFYWIFHSNEFSPLDVSSLFFYYGFFLIVDAVSALPAVLFEPSERKGIVLNLFTQRFGYRQMMYFVVLKSIKIAFEGVLVGWNKLERKATVLESYEAGS